MKKYKRGMRGPPHKIQNIDQSKTKHLHNTRRVLHKGIGCLRIHYGNISSKPGTQLLSLSSNPFKLQIKIQLS